MNSYNYSFNTTYQDIVSNSGDTMYRKEFLKAFYLEEWDDDHIQVKTGELFQLVEPELEKYKLFKNIKNYANEFPFKLEKDMLFMLLFQFDIFHIFHLCLQDFFSIGTFSNSNLETLKKILNK